VSKVEKSLGQVPGVTEATVNLATREARVICNNGGPEVAALAKHNCKHTGKAFRVQRRKRCESIRPTQKTLISK